MESKKFEKPHKNAKFQAKRAVMKQDETVKTQIPPMKPVPASGSYACETASYVWTDETREESFRNDGAFRQVAVQFWYPAAEKEEKFPLVVFSHGAFGYRMSNYSTYMELASNGYVVCSVEHPYHAIFSELEDGQIIMADKKFYKRCIPGK